MAKMIKPAISSFKSEGSDSRRITQMVREESDFKARLNWLEKQFQMLPNLSERIKLQDQKIQTLQDEQDSLRKIQLKMLDEMKGPKQENFNGQQSNPQPQIDSNLMKSFLSQLEHTVSDVMRNQSQRLCEIEGQLGQINNKFTQIKKDMLDDKIKIEAQNIANEKLKKDRSIDKLEILKRMQIKDDSERNYSSIFDNNCEKMNQKRLPQSCSEKHLQESTSQDSIEHFTKRKLLTDDEPISSLVNKLFTKENYLTNNSQWCPVHSKYPDMYAKQNYFKPYQRRFEKNKRLKQFKQMSSNTSQSLQL